MSSFRVFPPMRREMISKISSSVSSLFPFIIILMEYLKSGFSSAIKGIYDGRLRSHGLVVLVFYDVREALNAVACLEWDRRFKVRLDVRCILREGVDTVRPISFRFAKSSLMIRGGRSTIIDDLIHFSRPRKVSSSSRLARPIIRSSILSLPPSLNSLSRLSLSKLIFRNSALSDRSASSPIHPLESIESENKGTAKSSSWNSSTRGTRNER